MAEGSTDLLKTPNTIPRQGWRGRVGLSCPRSQRDGPGVEHTLPCLLPNTANVFCAELKLTTVLSLLSSGTIWVTPAPWSQGSPQGHGGRCHLLWDHFPSNTSQCLHLDLALGSFQLLSLDHLGLFVSLQINSLASLCRFVK
jgi:hypothetical protein